MQYWLMKSEPGTWSWDDQVARGDQGEIWDGVRNHQAAGHLRQMAVGDRAYFYHSGKAPAVVGIVEVIKAQFPDPSDDSGRFVAVTVRALSPLPNSVSLKRIKAERALADCLLVRQSRLSVMPLSKKHWDAIAQLAQTSVS